MAKSCKGLAMELVKCLSETDCVKVQKRPYKECAGEKVPNITSECVGLRETYFNCKRGQACDSPNSALNRCKSQLCLCP
uniref:Cytochrome c oxidase assembly factor 5 n=1 Tax=Leersia perrieri TaxID=77586 RepID=A0A0D9XFR1_9ORYZ